MTTRKNNRKSIKSGIRKGGATQCELLPFSRLSYDELHKNYQNYCVNANFYDKKFKNKDCCTTLERKFKNWTTDGRDFDLEQNDYDTTYAKINNIPEDDSYEPENFIRNSVYSRGGRTRRNSRRNHKRKTIKSRRNSRRK